MRRSFCAILGFLLLVCVCPAFADEDTIPDWVDTQPVHNPVVMRIGITDLYYVYAPSNEFDCALAIIGETSTKIQLDTPKFTALSNESTGGDFYDLAQLCYNAEDGNPVNPANLIWYSQVMTKIGEYGASHVWFCEATEEQIRAAHRDYMTVLEGGSLGSVASSSGVLTRYSVGYPSSEATAYVYSDSVYDLDTNTITSSGTRSTVSFPDMPANISYRYSSNSQFANKLNSFLNNGGSPILVIFDMLGNYVYIASLNGVTYRIENNTLILDSQVYYNRFRPQSSKDLYDVSGLGYLYIDNNAIVGGSRQGNASQFSLTSTYYTLDFFGVSGGGGGGGDNHWPDPTPIDEPVAPTVPMPPIGDPVTDPGEPTDVTFSPTVVIAPTGTDPTDYTPWLRAILQALNTIIEDMSTHCDHIKVAIRDWTQWLADRIDYLLYEYMGDLQSYLYQLFHWLAEEINFEFDTGDFPLYNDSRLIAWLRRIYYKLGSPVKTPTNVPSEKDVEQGFDFWAWLLGLINNLLGGIITDFVGDIGGFLAELTGTFPFSIPWDILAYLTLLDAQRETPRLVVTIPAEAGWWSSFQLEIDCAPYDSAMATVRMMVLIWWGFLLVLKTNWLDGVLEHYCNMVTGFFDRLTGKSVGGSSA